MASDYSISVIIPTRNGGSTLPELLAMLRQQSILLDDIHVADSASADDTLKIAESCQAKITLIDPKKFDHGGTRSLMAEKTAGDIIIYFTQDAVPASRDCIEKLLIPFRDHRVAVCYGRQLPDFKANYSAAELRKFNYGAKSAVRSFADRHQYGLKTIFASNSFAAYRRTALAEVNYFKDNLIFGEDAEIVGRLLKIGYKSAYVAEARVYHSHNYTYLEELRRSFDLGVFHAMESWLLETYGTAEGIGREYVLRQLAGLIKNRHPILLADSLWRNACKYAGYKVGRRYKLLPGQIIRQLSMNRNWWDKKILKNNKL
ncbi:MAG: glycosyl transferase [Deltaproteobacteria bacterium]|nr:MAG: glycosyl transferase [Deltaproteobacteria bacterium]